MNLTFNDKQVGTILLLQNTRGQMNRLDKGCNRPVSNPRMKIDVAGRFREFPRKVKSLNISILFYEEITNIA